MFCSWRKSLVAPCNCAFRLHGAAKEWFNRLQGLGEGTLVLRQQGLSLAKKTPVGLCVAYGEGGWNLLRDRLSGLELDISRRLEFHLMVRGPDRKPLLGVNEPGKPIHLSFRLDGLVWESPIVRHLILEFGGGALDCEQSRLLGAGMWLDEWERPAAAWDADHIGEVCRQLQTCRRLDVEVKACGQRNQTSFSPSFIDVSGGVLRIADRSLRHVVHADVADPACHLRRMSGNQWSLERNDEDNGREDSF